MLRKGLLTKLSLGLASVLSVGVFASGVAVAKDTKQVTLRVVTYFTASDSWGKTWKEAINDYMKKNPGVKIIDEATPTVNEAIRIKVKTDYAAGSEPDVTFFFTGSDTKPLAESGRAATWEAELKKDPAWAKNFTKSALEAVKYNGKQYALPYIGYYEGLICNKDIFDKYKVKVPTTFDELLKAVAVFKKHNIIPMAQSFQDPRYLLEQVFMQAGGVKGHNTPFDASWKKGFELVKKLYDAGAFPADANTLTDEAAGVLFRDKKAAMYINGSWAVGSLKDQKHAVVVNFPNVSGNKRHDVISGFGSGWYMSSKLNKSKNGAPLKFIKYMTSPTVMAKFIKVGGVPAIKCKVPTATPTALTGWDMLDKATSIQNTSDSIVAKDAWNKMAEGLVYYLSGEKTPAQVMSEAKKLNKQ